MSNKKEMKKAGIARRIFKWFGLTVLSVLIILGLIFEAPWKVITLLLIVLAACRILPKPAIKWFWLSVGVVVIAMIIWIFLPEEDGDWRPYTFDEELAALEAKRAIPDEENAATIYSLLLKDPNATSLLDYRPGFLDYDSDKLTSRQPWSAKDYPELAAWLQRHQSTIETLIKVSKIEKCRFPIAADSIAFGEHMKILSPMRRWTWLLSRAANNDLGEGRIDQGLEKQIAVLQMAKHLYQQPILVDLLVGMAIEALVTNQFDRFVIVGDATEAHLSVIEKALAEIKRDWGSDLPRILEGEKLLTKNLFSMFYEINPKGKVRLNRDSTAAIRAQFPEELPPLTYWRRKVMKAKTIFGWFFMPSTPQKAAKIIDASYEKLNAMAEPDFDWQKEPKEPSITSIKFNYRYLIEHLAGISEESYYKIHDIYLRITSDKRGSQLLIALRRYKNENGHWPESLDDIKSFAPEEIFVDPINGDSFVYKLTEENFTLYSKGKNSIDEGGKRDKWGEEETGADDWLIWSPSNSKEKEESKKAKRQKISKNNE